MKFNLPILLLSIWFLLSLACKKETKENTPPADTPGGNSTGELNVPGGFNYETTIDVPVQITLLSNNNAPLNGISVYCMDNAFEKGGKVWLQGFTNKNGVFSGTVKLPTRVKQLVINTGAFGIPQNILLTPNKSGVNAVLGGSSPNTFPTLEVILGKNGLSPLNKNAAKFSFKLGSWNSLGVPNYLEPTNDVVSNDFISEIRTVLKERDPLPPRRPDLISDSSTRRYIAITQTADVYVTFVHEGAGYRNTLFYYKYHKNNPPTSVNQIDSFYVVYPNASFSNSGGGLSTGNKVKIGRFGKDTIIAFGIAANGFNINTSTIGTGFWMFFGNKEFNPETNPAIRQHLVMLRDASSGRIVMGFEDLIRSASGCDHDFNDVMFYTTANPVNAIDTTGIAPLPPACPDADNDGITDCEDDFPADPLRAKINTYGTATLGFEDLWPSVGDFDMNDVVIDYRYQVITNAANEVKDVNGTFILKATGGMLENNFAVQFPTLRSNVQTISGAELEAGQTQAVAIIFKNMRAQMQMWNTVPEQDRSDTPVYNFSMTLTTPVPLTSFGLGEYNPFIWAESHGHTRGYEIHLPGKLPTPKANTALFGTEQDHSNPGAGKYYLTRNNLPWAINIPERFEYPIEKEDITGAHTFFDEWAESGGALYPDWYQDKNGYRNKAKIFKY